MTQLQKKKHAKFPKKCKIHRNITQTRSFLQEKEKKQETENGKQETGNKNTYVLSHNFSTN